MMPRVLQIEDSPDDAFLVKRALRRTGYDVDLEQISSAAQALYALRQRVLSHDGLPRLVLLDLNMSGMDGRAFLLRLRGEETLRQLPVVVLSNSSNAADVHFAYRNGANSYHEKPSTADGLVGLLKDLFGYWFDSALVP